MTSIVILRCAIDCASCTESLASASRSTRWRSSGRCASRRASSRRSSTEQPHPTRLAFDARHQHLDVAGGALPVQLGEAADRGQRCAQLVAGVGDEAAHPLLGSAGRSADDSDDATARWICASIPLSANDNRPTSVRGSRCGIRRSSCPAAMSAAVCSTSPADAGCDEPPRTRRRRAPAARPRRCRPATRSTREPWTDIGQVDGDRGQLAGTVHRHRPPLNVRVVDRADGHRTGPTSLFAGRRVRRRDR